MWRRVRRAASGVLRQACSSGVLPGFARLSRMRRLDAERPSGSNRGIGSKVHPATRAELGLLPGHAGGDAVDIGNLRIAQPERVAGTGLLLLGGIGPARRR